MVRVLYLTGDLGRGGQERQLYYLLKGLDYAKYEVHVVIWDFDPNDYFLQRLKSDRLPVHILALEAAWSTAQKFRLVMRYAREHRPQILHSYAYYLSHYAYWATRQLKGSVALGCLRTAFDDLLKTTPFYLVFLNFILPKNIVSNNFVGAEQVAHYRRRYGRKDGVFVIPNAIDLDEFAPGNSARPATPQEPFKTISIGRFVPLKRWEALIEVLGRLDQKGIEIEHTMVGYGPLAAELTEKVNQLGLQEKVKLVSTSQVIPLLQQADCLLHTSEVEGRPNVHMEAMATGLPVVTTNCGDVAQFIEDGREGYVVPLNDWRAFEARMQALAEDRSQAKEMGRQARRKAEAHFSLSYQAEKVQELYQTLLATA